MGAVRVCAENELRRHWLAYLALTVLVVIISGTVLAVASGARRTDTAFDRFIEYSRPADAFVLIGPSDQAHLDQVAALPEVDRLGVLYQYAVIADTSSSAMLPFAANIDGRLGTEIGRPLILDGRFTAGCDASVASISPSSMR